MGLCELRGLRRRPADGIPFGSRRRGGSVEMGSREASHAGFSGILADRRGNFSPDPAAYEKIFEIFENYVCICEKMGYNRVE